MTPFYITTMFILLSIVGLFAGILMELKGNSRKLHRMGSFLICYSLILSGFAIFIGCAAQDISP